MEFIIDVPEERVPEVFRVLEEMGVTRRPPSELLLHVEARKGHLSHVLYGWDLETLVESVNDLLDEEGLTPRVAGDWRYWDAGRVEEFLALATAEFRWETLRTEEPRRLSSDRSWNEVTREHPRLFGQRDIST